MKTADQARIAIESADRHARKKLQAVIDATKGATAAEAEALERQLARHGGCSLSSPSSKADGLQSQLATVLSQRGECELARKHLAAQEAYFAPGAGRLRAELSLGHDVQNALNENRAPNGMILNPYVTPWKDFNTFWEANTPRPAAPRHRRRLSASRPMPPTAPEMAVS